MTDVERNGTLDSWFNFKHLPSSDAYRSSRPFLDSPQSVSSIISNIRISFPLDFYSKC